MSSFEKNNLRRKPIRIIPSTIAFSDHNCDSTEVELDNISSDSVDRTIVTESSVDNSDSKPNPYPKLLWFFGVGVFVCAIAFCMCQFKFSSDKKCSYEMLSQNYPNQEDKVWRTLAIGIEDIINRRTKSPGVYLLVHKGGNTMQKLVQDIADQCSRCFGRPSKVIEMKERDFTDPKIIKDYGHAIEKFKKEVKNGKVALIVNLRKIPAESARALHTICDTHNPIANDIVIFLTLDTASVDGNSVGNAQEAIRKLWGHKLERHELDPLITRVTDQVITLRA